MKGFLEYVPGNSFLHRLNPVAKLAASLLIIFACFLTKSFILLGLILVLDLALAANCGMMRQTLGLAKVVAGFSLLLALIALFTTPEGAQLVEEFFDRTLVLLGHIDLEGVVGLALVVNARLARAYGEPHADAGVELVGTRVLAEHQGDGVPVLVVEAALLGAGFLLLK